MSHQFTFTFEYIESQIKATLEAGYHLVTCEEYFNLKSRGEVPKLCLVNRVDIDLSCKKARRLAEIFNRLGVKASFFVRLHAPEYNPFSFENYSVLKYIRDTGHEIGYHSEIIDQAAIWNEDPADCLTRDIQVLNRMLDIEVRGVASHGGTTGLNNLDFWKERSAKEFNLLYEAYEESDRFNLFKEAFYVSDSEWTRWKCYNKGKMVEGDRRSLGEHALDRHDLIYLLIHPDTYFEKHFYE
jgi:hypothetical protein